MTRIRLTLQDVVIRNRVVSLSTYLLISVSLITGCDLPGKPAEADRPVAGDEVKDFNALYSIRCAGCHGGDGKLGPAPPLNDPLFLTIVPDAELLLVISEGRAVTAGQRSPMPAFARANGGPLTDEQVKVLAEGIKQRWGGAASPTAPPYFSPAGTNDGKKDKGIAVFASACANCHGMEGEGVEMDGVIRRKINDLAFLALTSNKELRRIVITGRPDLGMPAYDGAHGRPADFRPLTSEQIQDLVVLLDSWRQGRKAGTE